MKELVKQGRKFLEGEKDFIRREREFKEKLQGLIMQKEEKTKKERKEKERRETEEKNRKERKDRKRGERKRKKGKEKRKKGKKNVCLKLNQTLI